MSPQVVLRRPSALTVGARVLGCVAVAAARLLLAMTRGRPVRIRRILRALLAGVPPATPAAAEAAHAAVVTVSLRCASPHGCLPRSVAVALLFRMRGARVRWVVGVSSPPPASHAWVETTDGPVVEPDDPRATFTPAITI
ncbi:lasso peptide biosynthesis B2 protein [Allosalinactinospora lopnorensis]|uniref:lasso peptide biosynthesis B2 protein n=1 Tax=Allosalinactinospora lopnorensis TaxID=1352348 RepID=UPI000623C9D8|nr:lasso peptide biosynthesis B2 protein [Allosalinactinospora lopnorensis]